MIDDRKTRGRGLQAGLIAKPQKSNLPINTAKSHAHLQSIRPYRPKSFSLWRNRQVKYSVESMTPAHLLPKDMIAHKDSGEFRKPPRNTILFLTTARNHRLRLKHSSCPSFVPSRRVVLAVCLINKRRRIKADEERSLALKCHEEN